MIKEGHLYAGMNQISEKQLNDAEKQFKTFESMINSMTPQERTNPDLLAKVSFLEVTSISACTPGHMCLTENQTVLPPIWGQGDTVGPSYCKAAPKYGVAGTLYTQHNTYIRHIMDLCPRIARLAAASGALF